MVRGIRRTYRKNSKHRSMKRRNTRGRINRKRKTVKRSIRRRSKKMSGGFIDPVTGAAAAIGLAAWAMPTHENAPSRNLFWKKYKQQRNHGSKIGQLRESAGTDEDGNALPIPGLPKDKSKDTILNVFTKCLGMHAEDANTLVEKLWGPNGSPSQYSIRSLKELKNMSQEVFNTGIGLTDYEKYILSRLYTGGHANPSGFGGGELDKWASDWKNNNNWKWERFYQMYGPVNDTCDWRNVDWS